MARQFVNLSQRNINFLNFLNILLIIHVLIYNFKESEGNLLQKIEDNLGIDLFPIKLIIDKHSGLFSDKGKQSKLLLF